MILIISHKEDYTSDYLVNKLNKRKIKYLRLNTEDIGTKHNITFRNGSSNYVSIDGCTSFSSVWFRRTKHPQNHISNEHEMQFFQRDFKSFLLNLWKIIDAKKWLSIPENIYSSENKLFQLIVANEVGFKVPKTIVSTDKNEIKKFYYENNQRIIIKPLFSGRFIEKGKEKLIFTNQVLEKHILNIQNYNSFPVIFQQEIPKDYELRITVVDGKVFTAKVDSQIHEETKIDWRKGKLHFKESSLPIEIENKCLEIVKKLGLKFGAIDLIKIDGEYIFLEVNPNGQWVWIETETNLKISNAIIDYLIT